MGVLEKHSWEGEGGGGLLIFEERAARRGARYAIGVSNELVDRDKRAWPEGTAIASNAHRIPYKCPINALCLPASLLQKVLSQFLIFQRLRASET